MKGFLRSRLVHTLIMLVLLAGAIAVPLAGNSKHSHAAAPATNQTQSDLPYPSWWNHTVCDTTKVSNSAPLSTGAFYRGVPACGPRSLPTDSSTEVIFPVSNWGEYEWQCVELSMRFMYLAYDVPAYNAPTGADVVDNYTNSSTNPLSYNNPILVPVPNTNPSTTNTVPQPGDIISFYANHTGVVMSTNVDSSGNGTLKVLEQNASSSGIVTIKVGSNANLPPWVLQSSVKNWLHHTVDVLPQSAPATAQVKVSGTGFGATEQVVITFDGETQVGTTTTNSRGAFSTTIAIPSSAQSGLHIIQPIGQTSGFSPKTAFYVQTVYVSAGQNGFYALNTADGSMRWHYSVGGAGSPAVANGVVYFGADAIYALNTSDGSLLWRYPTGASGTAFDSSPTVANGVLYIGSFDTKVYALNAANGTLLWRYQTGGQIVSSPAVANGVVYIGSGVGDNNVYALNAANGSLLWRYQTGDGVNSSPAVAGGIVVISSLDGYLYALKAANGSLVWRSQLGASGDLSPALVNGVVYTDSGTAYALKASNGSLIWQSPAPGSGTLYIGLSPAVVGGVVYTGGVYAFSAANGSQIWYHQVTTPTGATGEPRVTGGVVYVNSSNDGNTYALNASDGSTLWSYPTGGGTNTPAVAL